MKNSIVNKIDHVFIADAYRDIFPRKKLNIVTRQYIALIPSDADVR